MSIRKSTHVSNNRIIHTWTDDEINFRAVISKRDWIWGGELNGEPIPLFSHYSSAVDWLMDKHRLAKVGYDSWEDAARDMAEDWDNLSDFEQQDLIDAAQQMARDEL